MTPEQLNAIEKRCNAATPGPWYQVDGPWGDGDWVNALSEDPHGGTPICEQIDWDACQPESVPDGYDVSANMAFIANARTDIPTLIAAVRELEAENERLRKCLDLGVADVIGATILGENEEYLDELDAIREKRLTAAERAARQKWMKK